MAPLVKLQAMAESGEPVWVRSEVTLGRRERDDTFTLQAWTEDDVVSLGVTDSLVSRQHLRLYWEGEALWAQDLGSLNGTWVNEEPLPRERRGRAGTPRPLPKGKVRLRLGLRCLLEVAPVASPLGITQQDWGRLSGRLSCRDMQRALWLWQWSQEMAALGGRLSVGALREWFKKGEGFLAGLPQLHGELSELVQRLELQLPGPDYLLGEEERQPVADFCQGLVHRLSAHYLRR